LQALTCAKSNEKPTEVMAPARQEPSKAYISYASQLTLANVKTSRNPYMARQYHIYFKKVIVKLFRYDIFCCGYFWYKLWRKNMHKVHKVCRRFVAAIVIIVALALAVVVSIWKEQALTYIIYVSRFFDVMIPVLGVGALIKYLMCGHCHHCNHNEHDSCKK
jgi:hypothetical protein